VGLLEDWKKSATIAVSEGDYLWLVGAISAFEARKTIGQSLWLREIYGRAEGAPPPVDLEKERKNGDLVRFRLAAGNLAAVHDVSDGGLLVALTEMALAGNCGIVIDRNVVQNAANLFGEAQGRYIIATKSDGAGYANRWLRDHLPLGRATGDSIRGPGILIPLADLRAAHEGFFPKLMGSELTPEF
jgi:phosphoribosylformylglycinamidine synthase